MRMLGAGFGLVALLMVVGIVVWLASMDAAVTIPAGKKARIEAEQIAGISNGIRSTDSAVLEPQYNGSKASYLLVSGVVPGGPMANYGLMNNDCILEVGPFQVSDDPDTAKLMVYEAPQRLMPITLLRNKQRITLSSDKLGQPAVVTKTPPRGTPAAPTAGAPATPSGTTAPPPPAPAPSGLQGQLEAIQRAAQQ